jgi:outer membrane protein
VYYDSETPQYLLRLSGGRSTQQWYYQVLTFDHLNEKKSIYTVLSADFGILMKSWKHTAFPIDLYLKMGFSEFDQKHLNRKGHNRINEVLIFAMAYHKFHFGNGNIFRFGFGEGGSLLKDYIQEEVDEGESNNSAYSYYLNYIDTSFDFDLGRLFGIESLYNFYIGYNVKHRSGAYGLINNVTKVASNYHMFHVEYGF